LVDRFSSLFIVLSLVIIVIVIFVANKIVVLGKKTRRKVHRNPFHDPVFSKPTRKERREHGRRRRRRSSASAKRSAERKKTVVTAERNEI
jgi:hypothetical protein